LYPFKSHWLDLAGGRMHYLDEGPRDAPPVLMLHGNPTWSFYYRNLVLALRDRYRCIVPDHIGCGLSDKPGDEDYAYRLARRIEDIEALYCHTGINRPMHLVVHDWGGMIGFGWAVKHQPEIASTVILNTAAFPMPRDKRLPLALRLAGRTPLGPPLVRGLNAFSGIAARVAFKKPVSKEVRAAYTGPYNSWANRIATLRFVQDIPLRQGDPGYDIVAATAAGLSRFKPVPAMIAWGEQDFVFDEPFLVQWQAHLPEARVLRYPDCGHYVLEDAGEDLLNEITRFLDLH
jgi:haloalkane dehalogenase